MPYSLQRFCFLILLGMILFFMGFVSHTSSLNARENPVALFSIGGGYWDAGERFSGGHFQTEYKWGIYFWRQLRPQITFLTPQFSSFFVGLGIGYEFYLSKHLILTPSFTPGYYYKGSGRNLGFPLEFRSCAELAYESRNKIRIGVQVFHISNAHLAHKNPGANSLNFFIAFPMKSFCF